MNTRILLFAPLAVVGTAGVLLTHSPVPVQAQSASAHSVQSLKATNQRLEAKIRSMQIQIDSLQKQLLIAQLHAKVGSALPYSPNSGPLNLSPFQATPFYQAPTSPMPTYPSLGYAMPTYPSPKPPRLYNIPDSRAILISQVLH